MGTTFIPPMNSELSCSSHLLRSKLVYLALVGLMVFTKLFVFTLFA